MDKLNILLGSKINLPPAVCQWAESLKSRAGVYATTHRGIPVYLIAAGERPSGGYSVAVAYDGNTILYSIISPHPRDMVIQMITYPYEVVMSPGGQTLRFIRKGKRKYEEKPVQTPPLLD